MHRLRLGIALLALCSPLLAAGNFHFGKTKFEPTDSFAFQVDTKDPGKPMTVVVLSNFKIDKPAVIAAIDPINAVAQQAADKGSFAVVRLVAPNKCGLFALIGPTQQNIDVGDSFAAKMTTSTATRVAGECATTTPGKMFDDVYDFKLPFDVAVTPIPKPTPLPADGGDPGKSYLALVKGIQSSDWQSVRVRMPKDEVREKPSASDIKMIIEGLALNYPKTAKVVGGVVKGDRANIEIRGIDHDGKKIKGTVAMSKADGQWRVLDQSMYFDM